MPSKDDSICYLGWEERRKNVKGQVHRKRFCGGGKFGPIVDKMEEDGEGSSRKETTMRR